MRLPLAGLAALIALTPVQGSAQSRPPTNDQEACEPDVFRLCGGEIPDEARIVVCLNRKVAELSPACRSVIDPPLLRKKRKVKVTELPQR